MTRLIIEVCAVLRKTTGSPFYYHTKLAKCTANTCLIVSKTIPIFTVNAFHA